MSIKDHLTLFRWDHLSHYQWAQWFSTVAACVVLPVMGYGMGIRLWVTLASTGFIAILVAYIAGRAGEEFDRKANEAAEAVGLSKPHEVSQSDVNASTLGGVILALPLFVAAIVVFITH